MKLDLEYLKNEMNNLEITPEEKFDDLIQNEKKLINFCIKNTIDIQKVILEYDLDINVKNYENKENFIDVNSIETNKNNYNTVELFAGTGGFILGFEKAGFETLLANEIDKHASNTLKLNRPDLNVINEDIEFVVSEGIKKFLPKDTEIDVLTGGFPCQSFSFAGKRKGILDTRGTLFYWYAQVLNQIKPKIFVAENVKGLVNHDKGRTLQTMINIFEEEGYVVSYKVLNSNDYNVAQKRHRIFIVGIREDIYTKPFKFPEPLEYKPVLRDALTDVPESEGKVYPEHKKKVLDLVSPGGYWKDLPVEIQKSYMKKSYYLGGGKTGMARRISWDEPSLTLTTSPDQKQTERCHPDETRPFTVREYARIQSFPDSWKFSGPITSKYKQIGNAVPVTLAYYVALAVKVYLKDHD